MYINIFTALILTAFGFIWTWKTFEAVNKPGWWVLSNFVPFIGWLMFFIFLGIAAWGDSKTAKNSKLEILKNNKKKNI